MKILTSLILILAMIFAVYYFMPDKQGADKITGPRYSWVAFSSFWNKRTPESIKIKDARESSSGYFVEITQSISMRIYEDDKIITHLCANYTGKDNYAGGLIFTKLKNRMIDIGTFQWPHEQIIEVARVFHVIGKTEKQYTYRTSEFKLFYSEPLGWTFCLKFM